MRRFKDISAANRHNNILGFIVSAGFLLKKDREAAADPEDNYVSL